MVRKTNVSFLNGKLVALAAFAGLICSDSANSQQLSVPVPALNAQMELYNADVTKTIVEMQPWRQHQVSLLASGEEINLISLNPNVNMSFLLMIGKNSFHIDNADPAGQQITLGTAPGAAIEIATEDSIIPCDLWAGDPTQIQSARDSGLAFAPLCGGRLYLRNAIAGSRSSIERATDFLRDNVWQGEQIVRLVRNTLYKDAFAEFGELIAGGQHKTPTSGPTAARIEPLYAEQAISPSGFGLTIDREQSDTMNPGAWYPATGLPGVFASAIQPRTISAEVLNGPGTTNRLDSVEGRTVDYFVAFDLARYGIGFALGTDHPRLNWSPRPQARARIPGLPGPDGFADANPLVRSGMVSPDLAERTIAAFTGGFKRQHGAFRSGEYSVIDTGKHYGFIERGVIYSKLKTELSTLYVLADGTIGMKTWTLDDNDMLPRVMFARQNGVPLIEFDPETGTGVPGRLVTQWVPGNWSGSAEAELRTLRAGACLQENGSRRYLVFGYFSTATPSAMARTFQAYGCRYAMLLDMNALEHAYMALYPRQRGKVHVEHLISSMSQFDKKASNGNIIPRFLGYPDNRDFFYLYSKDRGQ